MSYKLAGTSVAALVVTSLFAVNAHAIAIDFDFTGECDDCAFLGNPSDIGFNPLGDGLTESVSGTLNLSDATIDSNGFVKFTGSGSATFTYNGSSLINAFTMGDPFLFTDGLLESGEVQAGSVFTFSSSQNLADPDNPLSFDFPNFCTALGQQVLGSACDNIGLVSFELDSAGNWSIFGEEAFDIGGSGQLSPSAAAVPEPASVALLALGLAGIGFTRRRASGSGNDGLK